MSVRGFLLLFFVCIGFGAHAQLLSIFQKHERLPQLNKAFAQHQQLFLSPSGAPRPHIGNYQLALTDYSLENAEQSVMKMAQHNMRFHVYDQASYNFADLAQLFWLQNRFSEAKWYYLQSCLISRQQNNHKLTFLNLCRLGLLKSEIGDFVLAQQDLLEARDIAMAKGWLVEVIEAEKKLALIRQKRIASLRTDMRYAEMANAN